MAYEYSLMNGGWMARPAKVAARDHSRVVSLKHNVMRILVVEDEKRIADFLQRGMESGGYAVDVANDGSTALDLVHATEYDLIILDLGLPDIDGLQVLQKIRNRKTSPPVLILSARDAVEDRVKGLEVGADDYLVKPFAFVELLARARALLRRGQPTPERLQVGDLTLDCIRRKVTRGGENIELAPKEFSILEYMMRNRGRPLSRTMIVEHVWDMDYDGLTNIVDVYIRHLRAKIDDPFQTRMIHTVRGIGYMLDLPETADRPVESGAGTPPPRS
jgi:two-component system copper resistance phosphate regulon response regulator CusR